MSDTNVASLGFQVDSSGLDQAKQKLGETTEAAKRTEDQSKKTGDAISNIGKGGVSGLKSATTGFSELEQAAKTAGTSVGVLESMAKRSGVSIGEMAARVAAAKTGIDGAAVGTKELGAALLPIAPAATAAAAGLAGKSTALTDLNRAMRTASPLLNEFDSGLGHILSSSTRVRGSLGVLATVVGGEVVFALAKAADEVERSQKMFQALTGSATSGTAVFNAIKETARSSGLEFGTIASAIDKASQGMAKFADKNIIYANSADQAAQRSLKLNEAFGTLGRMLQTAGATAKEDSEIIGAVSQSIQRTGGITADTFQKIRDISLPMARAIADAFGKKDIDEFQQQLEKTPIKGEQLLQVLRAIKPMVDAAFDANPVTTFGQRVDEVQASWKKLVEDFGNAGGFNLARNALDTLGGILRQDAADIKGIGDALAYLADKASTALSVISQLNPMNLGAKLNQLGQSVGNADIAGMSAGGGGGNDFGDLFDSSTGGFDATDFRGFASGGSFKVDGSGGTDSQIVTFKATPGEVVTIATPDQAASGIASLSAVSATTDIGDLLKEQTKQIVEAINGLKTTSTSAAVSAAVPVTVVGAAGAASGGGVPAFGAGGSSGGGGGGSSSSPFAKLEAEAKKAEQELMARERELGGTGGGSAIANALSAFSGIVGGRGSSIKGGFGSQSFPVSAPVGQFAGAGGVQMNPNSMQSQDALDAIPGFKSEDFGWIGTQQAFQNLLDDSVQQLKNDWASQRAFNATIASQGGRPSPSSNYSMPQLGRYDENMNFIPNPGRSGDYTFAGRQNPAGPYQPGISAPLSFPSYLSSTMSSLRPMGGFDEAGFKDAFGRPIKDVEKNTNETNRTLDTTNVNLDELQRRADATTREVDSGAQSTVGAVDAASQSISSAISSAISTMGSEISSAMSAIGNALGGAGGGGLGSRGGSSGGGDSSSFGSSGGYNPSSDPFGASGSSGSDLGDYNFGGFGSPGFPSSGSVDSPPLDFSQMGGSSFDESGFAGAFAQGGRFTVGGDGGTDTTPVKFLATRGEIVTISRPGIQSGIRVPQSMLRPGSSDRPAPVVQHVTHHHKYVTMKIEPGIQAEGFLRSRAQIARGM